MACLCKLLGWSGDRTIAGRPREEAGTLAVGGRGRRTAGQVEAAGAAVAVAGVLVRSQNGRLPGGEG